eukprot:TRINITY_DN8678_c0_g1_i4.p1 TRINITY_DN8678_c0_g1~~TRINITY_DN8678_c0_g1_i4.p1  ORF type:complete len:239 (+),score=28.74 TRINITY_DN8678_c0_g1_i4:382-1098(+)
MISLRNDRSSNGTLVLKMIMTNEFVPYSPSNAYSKIYARTENGTALYFIFDSYDTQFATYFGFWNHIGYLAVYEYHSDALGQKLESLIIELPHYVGELGFYMRMTDSGIVTFCDPDRALHYPNGNVSDDAFIPQVLFEVYVLIFGKDLVPQNTIVPLNEVTSDMLFPMQSWQLFFEPCVVLNSMGNVSNNSLWRFNISAFNSISEGAISLCLYGYNVLSDGSGVNESSCISLTLVCLQ